MRLRNCKTGHTVHGTRRTAHLVHCRWLYRDAYALADLCSSWFSCRLAMRHGTFPGRGISRVLVATPISISISISRCGCALLGYIIRLCCTSSENDCGASYSKMQDESSGCAYECVYSPVSEFVIQLSTSLLSIISYCLCISVICQIVQICQYYSTTSKRKWCILSFIFPYCTSACPTNYRSSTKHIITTLNLTQLACSSWNPPWLWMGIDSIQIERRKQL